VSRTIRVALVVTIASALGTGVSSLGGSVEPRTLPVTG